MNLVVWRDRALDQLADIWVQAAAADRPAIETAIEQINRILRDDPASQGESRAGNWRVMFQRPLSIVFTFNSNARKVIVSSVKLIRSRRR